MTPLVLHHGNCADGFTAAWAVRKNLLTNFPSADYVPMTYGDAPPDVTDRLVIIVDFSFKRPVMDDIYAKCKQLVVLDHHASAEKELAGFGGDKATVMFDMTKSGARLAWEFFHPEKPVPWLVSFVEDRDLWLFKLPNSKEVNAALGSYERTFPKWDTLNLYPWPTENIVEEGAAILRYQRQVVDQHAAGAVEIDLDGYKVLSCNATTLISEIGERLCENRPFSATYLIRGDVDVSQIARRHGGGGHKQASGFTE